MKAFVAVVAGYFVAFALVHTALLLLALVGLRRHARGVVGSELRRMIRSPLAPPISILVPAYNEEVGITDSVRSLLALDYPTTEVVVVSDGSTDGTVQRMAETFNLVRVERPTPPYLPHRPVRAVYVPRGPLNLLLLDKENGGKADALNAGINFSHHPLVCGIDADSILEQDALVKAAMPFVEDPRRTVATGGVVRIANGCRIERGRVVQARLPRGYVPMVQVVEYLRAFFAARTGWSAVNGLLIVSGAFGLFRKDVAIAAGGYRTDTVGEDMELVVRLHRELRRRRRPYRIVYVPDPVCWTEGPTTLRVLRRQRRRWQQGMLETLINHRGMVGNPRYRAVGLVALPSVLLFEVLGPLLELAGYAVAAIAWAAGAVSLRLFLLFLALSLGYGLLLSLGAIALEDAAFGRHPGWDDLGRILLFALLENAGYRQVTHLWKLEGSWQLLRKGDWGAMERTGLSRSVEETLEGEVGLR